MVIHHHHHHHHHYIIIIIIIIIINIIIIIIFPTLTCVDSLEKTSVQSPPGELVGAGVVGVTELANITMMIMKMTIMVIMMINTMIQGVVFTLGLPV